MESLKLIDYIKMRIKKRRTGTPMGDLLYDMERDMNNLEECLTAGNISIRIGIRACPECQEVFGRFFRQYRNYCRNNGYLAEDLIN